MQAVSRRAFLSTAISYAAVKGANDRLLIGVVGCGGMATHHMQTLVKNKDEDNIDIIGVSDLWDKRAQQAGALTGGKPFRDYRQVLEIKDVDYVLTATPEHWHAQVTLDALAAGKHVYSEKPMTRTVEQAKKVVAKVKQSGLKLQVGVQGMSDDSYETAHRYIQEGVLGKVVLAQIDYSRNHRDDFWIYKVDPDIKPGVDFDWVKWQGYTKKRPFDQERYFSWRRFWDYSGGISGDLFVHRVTRIIKALGLTFPDTVCASGGKFQFTQGKAEIPDTMNVLLDYPGGLTV